MSKDINWIDWAKFIGIYLVVLGHVLQKVPDFGATGLKNLWDCIYLFHMPLFFVISGYLYKQMVTLDFKKILMSLLVPYLIYQFLYMPLWNWWKKRMISTHPKRAYPFTFCPIG